jgi:leader peptidase (prepilin peptidase)/N-methyltransferase
MLCCCKRENEPARQKVSGFETKIVSSAYPLGTCPNGTGATVLDFLLILTTLTLAVLLAWSAIIDLREFRIPDAVSKPLIAAGLFVSALLPITGFLDACLGAAMGYVALAGLGEVYYRIKATEGIGLGDAKLFAAAGAWLGWRDLPSVLLTAALCGLVWAVVSRQARIAFGPFIALAFWTIWVFRLTAFPLPTALYF